MKKLLALFAIVALSSVLAKAEDKGTEFKFGGEMREQFNYDNNPSFSNSGVGGATSENNFAMKNQFHINAVSSDKLQAYVNLLHYSLWGAGVPSNNSPYGTGNGGVMTAPGAVNSNNALQVNEAWMWWKTSDMFALRVGRQAFDYGDGLEFSKNDWLLNPYTVDALAGRFSWDFLDLDVGGGKLADAGVSTVVPGNTTDLEVDMYALYASFKNLPDFLKKADVFATQINADNAVGTSYAPFAPSMSPLSQWALTSYGIHVKGDVSQVDYRVDAVLESGKQKNGAGVGQDINFNGNMIDVEAGYSFPEFMKGRVYANYHMDSGQDLTAVSTSSYNNAQYQPLFYDQHTYSGLMDVFGWGNLTDIRFGVNLQPGEDTTVGLQANLYSRTQGNGSYSGQGNAFGNMYVLPTVAGGAAAQAAAGKNLGTEIDLWANHSYGHGFTMLGQIGYITLGNYYATAINGGAPGSAYQFVAQAKYAF